MHVVALLARSDLIGGAHVHVLDLAQGLRDHDIHTTVLVGGSGKFVQTLEEIGIPRRTLSHLGRPIHPWRDGRAAAELLAHLRELRPTLLACHAAKAGFLGRVCARRLGIPAIYTPHGWTFDAGVPKGRATLYLALERIAARLPGTIIDVCDHDRRLALEKRVGRDSQHVTIHNGVPDVPARFLADPGAQPPRLLMVARFEPQKDHATFLKALGGLRHLPWSADLIGTGAARSQMRSLAEAEGLGGRVTFKGARDDVAECLSSAQIFVLTSHWEGLPLTVLEAMRAGLPVVATEVGGIPEAVEHERSGILVPPRDVGALRSSLERLLTDPQARASIGAAARRRFKERFTVEPMLRATADLYRIVTHLAPGAAQIPSESPR